jgi:hypothetical protein
LFGCLADIRLRDEKVDRLIHFAFSCAASAAVGNQTLLRWRYALEILNTQYLVQVYRGGEIWRLTIAGRRHLNTRSVAAIMAGQGHEATANGPQLLGERRCNAGEPSAASTAVAGRSLISSWTPTTRPMGLDPANRAEHALFIKTQIHQARQPRGATQGTQKSHAIDSGLRWFAFSSRGALPSTATKLRAAPGNRCPIWAACMADSRTPTDGQSSAGWWASRVKAWWSGSSGCRALT